MKYHSNYACKLPFNQTMNIEKPDQYIMITIDLVMLQKEFKLFHESLRGNQYHIKCSHHVNNMNFQYWNIFFSIPICFGSIHLVISIAFVAEFKEV